MFDSLTLRPARLSNTPPLDDSHASESSSSDSPVSPSDAEALRHSSGDDVTAFLAMTAQGPAGEGLRKRPRADGTAGSQASQDPFDLEAGRKRRKTLAGGRMVAGPNLFDEGDTSGLGE